MTRARARTDRHVRRRAIWNTLSWNATCEECGLTTRSILHPKGGEQVLRASPAPLDSEASLLASHLRTAVDAFSHVCMICCSAPTSTMQLGMIAVIPPERKPNAAAVPTRRHTWGAAAVQPCLSCFGRTRETNAQPAASLTPTLSRLDFTVSWLPEVRRTSTRDVFHLEEAQTRPDRL